VRRLLIAFAVGVVFGALVTSRARTPVESPWPAPSPILSVVDEAGLDRAQCDAELIEREWACRIVFTGRPSPPRWTR
jgi:hypothetical protein